MHVVVPKRNLYDCNTNMYNRLINYSYPIISVDGLSYDPTNPCISQMKPLFASKELNKTIKFIKFN